MDLFKNCTAKVPEEMSLSTIVEHIRNDQDLRDKTECYRNAYRTMGKESAAGLKRCIMAFAPVAQVDGKRQLSCVKKMNGVVLCDFDNLPAERLTEARQRVNDDPHTLLSYLTVSGLGLRVLARYEMPEGQPLEEAKKAYPNVFRYINEYYQRLTGAPFDGQCKDLIRLSIMAHDPDCYFQPQAALFSLNEVECGATVMKKLQDKGRQAICRDRKRANKEVERIFNEHVAPILLNEKLRFAPGCHNKYVMRTGYLLNLLGVKKEEAIAWTQEQFGMEYPATAHVIKSCYNKEEEHGAWVNLLVGPEMKSRKLRTATQNEIDVFLKTRIKARRNLIKNAVEVCWIKLDEEDQYEMYEEEEGMFRTLTDEDLNTLSGYIEKDFQLKARPEDIFKRLNSFHTKAFNPLVEYLRTLPKWQEGDTDYITELAHTVHLQNETPQLRTFIDTLFKKWFVGMVKGWTEKNTANHLFLIMQGDQGCYKTTWLSELLPPELSDLLKIKVNSANISKDDVLAMSGNALIIHDELDIIDPRQNSDLKAMVTTKVTKERTPYDRTAKVRKNIATLCGTTNQDRFLSDTTGSRRYLVMAVDRIDSPFDYPFNYEGIYAQAKALAKDKGFEHFVGEDEQKDMKIYNHQFELISCEKELIQSKFRVPTERDFEAAKVRLFTASDILIALQTYSHFMHLDVQAIGRIMKELGYSKDKSGHNHTVRYSVVELEWGEIDRIKQQMALDAKRKEEEEKEKKQLTVNQAEISFK
jgi:hypothetical protein